MNELDMIEHGNPLISIALCTYNGEKHIKQQLESLVTQTYAPIEIIVTDDLSKDKTWEILNEYSKTYSFIKLYQNEENLGFVKNFEKAISLCCGEYIALCDQDDIWLENKLETVFSHIEGYDLVYHDSCFIDENDNPILSKKMSDHFYVYDGPSNLPFLIANCVAGHAMLFRKSLVAKFLPFKEGFFHDWWIIFVAATVGKIKAIPDVLVKYRQHHLSVTDSLLLKSEPIKNYKTVELNIDLKWIEHCLAFNNQKNADEIKMIYEQLKAYTEGERGFKLFFFLLRYYNMLFYLHLKKKKLFLSRLNKIRKTSFYKPTLPK